MQIADRVSLWGGKRLPFDSVVEFLESTGTQWIDTGVAVTAPSTVSVSVTKVSGNFNFGLTHANVTAGTWLGVRTSITRKAYFKNYKTTVDVPNTWQQLRWDGSSGLYADGALVGAKSASVGTDAISSTSWPIFAMHEFNGGGVSQYSAGQISSVQIAVSGVLVRDFIPVRKGTVGYLYDRVSGKLFGNAGTGDFVLGPDVVPVEYIESHGTEYIDTGYVPNMNSVFDVTFSPNNVDFVGHPVHGNAYAATNKYASSTVNPLTLWTGNNYNNRFFYAPVAMNGLVVGQKYHIVQSAASLSRDGVVVGNYDSSQMRTPLVEPMWLFAYMNTQTERLYGLLRMYSWNASELGISMRSMLPVRVGTDATSWEGAMMDVLTRRIYRNAGTGAFGYGNDLKYPIPSE